MVFVYHLGKLKLRCSASGRHYLVKYSQFSFCIKKLINLLAYPVIKCCTAFVCFHIKDLIKVVNAACSVDVFVCRALSFFFPPAYLSPISKRKLCAGFYKRS